MQRPLRIIILGATGSIGDSVLKIVRAYPKHFEIVALSAHQNTQKLTALAREFSPKAVAVTDQNISAPTELPITTTLHTGPSASSELLEYEYDMVIAAMVGAAGVLPVMKAIKDGKTVALANKEALVCAGSLMMDAAKKSGATLLPIDSEHNAIYQLLQGHPKSGLENITLTASGGPFLSLPIEKLAQVTPAQAIAHPKWSMGAKISVDSATMMNKGLECIEAHWLFDIEAEKINVLIHPEAMVHGMITFRDGSCFMHASPPDMTIPISYCLFGASRAPTPCTALPPLVLNNMQFMEVDERRFPALRLCREALALGQSATIALNAANEVAVQAFLEGQIRFTDIVRCTQEIIAQLAGQQPKTIEDVAEIDKEARIKARETLKAQKRTYA